ncbi:uncharacterized protein N7483_009120 [Penicillium malachiteum]|uniref:uncharacterized protein n=1 Tax=Penicillium malachiteum TaxID=1324776 RepID=UPI002548E760|nr:uncharacterized protein N7483_009120 [Penicillium malachiteum]KAJ5721186.1 hypothetical protein N7483_009120 [Penicillium malachiteum]
MVRPSMYTPALRCATKVVAAPPRSPPPGFWFPGMQRLRDSRPSGKDSSMAIGQGLCLSSPSPLPLSGAAPSGKDLSVQSLSAAAYFKAIGQASSVRTVSRWIDRKHHVFKRIPRKKQVQATEHPPLVDEQRQSECEDHSEPSHKNLGEVASQPTPTIGGVIGVLALSFGVSYLLSKLF